MANTGGARVHECVFDGSGFVVIAGPCAVESESQVFETAKAVARAGARMLRGGAFKPRTSPYTFQGLGIDGLKLLSAAGAATGLPVVTELMSPLVADDLARYANMVQIGSRSMDNRPLLEAAAGTGLPILLKRGMMATIDEMVDAAEDLQAHGARSIVLCERGVRGFDTNTRNLCDITAVPLLQKRTGLPVIVDPSHATGVRDLIAPVSKAAVAVGADGLIIEVHPCPERALSDGPQSLTFEQFANLMRTLEPHLSVWRMERDLPTAEAACAV